MAKFRVLKDLTSKKLGELTKGQEVETTVAHSKKVNEWAVKHLGAEVLERIEESK